MQQRYRDRMEAGKALATLLADLRGQDDVVVLALPRGGVPVAAQIAWALGAPLDLMIVRKLGLPGQEEFAMGAIASGGVQVMNPDVARLDLDADAVHAVIEREQRELLRRERAYRGDRIPLSLRGKRVVLIDDGLATGSTMLAAVRAVRQQEPAAIVVAVPVAPPDTCRALEREADRVVCGRTPLRFYGVGQWYEDFTQTSDEEVRALLKAHWESPREQARDARRWREAHP